MWGRPKPRARWHEVHLVGDRNPPLAQQRIRACRQPSDPAPLRRLLQRIFA